MSDEIGSKKIGKIGSTEKTKAIKKADAVGNVDKVEQVKGAQSIAGIKGIGVSGKIDGGRTVTPAERARLLQIVDDEAKKMFIESPKKRDLIIKAVSKAIDSGLIVEESEDSLKTLDE
jgi:hypothetical protein